MVISDWSSNVCSSDLCLNRISRAILGNAANAIAGMVDHPPVRTADSSRDCIGITMFGVTSPCVDQLRARLGDHECLVFHATGTGGQALEKLVARGMTDGGLEITSPEERMVGKGCTSS